MMKISPVESLDICGLSLLSQAKLAGREQLLGQAPLLTLIIIFTAAVVLVLGSADWPFLNAATERRYPSCGERSLFLVRNTCCSRHEDCFSIWYNFEAVIELPVG